MKPMVWMTLAALLLMLPNVSAGNSWLVSASADDGAAPPSCGGVQLGGAGCVMTDRDGNTWLFVADGNTWLIQASTQCATPSGGCTYTVLGLGLL